MEAAREIKRHMPKEAIVVVKRGPEGAIAIDADGAFFSAAAPSVKVVDTIGAGDVFNAAFLAALADGQPLAACLVAGMRVASQRHFHTSPPLWRPLPATTGETAS